jgi:phosphoribosylanthranilate isomerase
MNIKVCGITELKQLQQLDALNVEFIGMDFQSYSPRFISEKLSKNDIKKADFDFKKVGIFSNPEMIEVLDAIDDYGLDVVQLNGNESAEMCEDLSSEVEVIKAFNIDKNTKDIDALVATYDAVCDYYLFDTSVNNDEQFDWNILVKAKIEKPFFLSGGIGIDDITRLKGFKHPDFYGVNVNSKLEKEPGVKDMALVLKFTHGFK